MTALLATLTARLPGTVRSEFVRLWRPALRYVGLGLTALFAVLVSLITFLTAEEAGGAQGDGAGPGGFVTIEAIEAPGGFLTALDLLGDMVGLIVLAIWALAVAADYDSGLIRILTQAQPNRARLLGGKVGALIGFTAIITALTTLVVVLMARPSARLAGISTDAWRTDFASELASGYLNLTIAAIAWGSIGLLVAVLSRSAGVAIAAGIGYLLIFEGIIGIVADDITDYLPGGTIGAVASGGGADLSWLTALTITTLYIAAALRAALLIFRNRDITS